MKTLRTIKETKYHSVGEILRVSDKEADQKVDSGYWEYVPKSEYKKNITKEALPEKEVVKKKKIKNEKNSKKN